MAVMLPELQPLRAASSQAAHGSAQDKRAAI